MSLPSRERGLKYKVGAESAWSYYVAPFTGAWIEIRHALTTAIGWCVAPFTGAWIEISLSADWLSLGAQVAPFTGAWIEMTTNRRRRRWATRRSLHGSVD